MQPVPLSQLSAVHSLLSLQLAVISAYWQPKVVLHESVVHLLLSSQTTAVLEQPVLFLQASFVQALLSSQEMIEYWQPDAVLQESAVQALLSLQFMVA
jgi:hypothetical protein